LGGVVVGGVIVDGAPGRIAHTGAEIVERMKDVCVAPEQAGDQHGEEDHDHGDDT
jgi:hypothetical protein